MLLLLLQMLQLLQLLLQLRIIFECDLLLMLLKLKFGAIRQCCVQLLLLLLLLSSASIIRREGKQCNRSLLVLYENIF